MLSETVANVGRPDGSAQRWPEDFLDFYRRHFDGLVRTAGALLGRSDIAQEVAQDALLKLAKVWDDVEAPYGYVRRSVVNASYDQLRRRRRQRRLVIEADECVDQGRDPAPDITAIELALRQLSPRRQAALALRFYEDLDYEEIALLMECRPATARSLVHRGLADLRRMS